MSYRIVRVAPTSHIEAEPEWLGAVEPVLRQLRPQLPADFVGHMTKVFATGGELIAAVQDDAVHAVAVFRSYINTLCDVFFYVDDLITDDAHRSRGAGKALLDWLSKEALNRGAKELHLDSGTHRIDAHRFYHREGLTIRSFHFIKKPL